MSNRVEICGIDTSTLPKISHEEGMKLIQRAQKGDKEAKDYFILANMRLVLSLVQRFAGRRDNADDVFQVGCVGLIKAMDNFDTSTGLRFSTYAVPMIIGEIRRFLRDGTCLRVSRSIRDTAYKVLKTRELLETKSNKEATVDEIAAALSLDVHDVVYALDAISDPVSLFDPIYHDDDETLLVMDQIADEKNSDDIWLRKFALSEAMRKLDERERQIIMLRYYEGKTQIEVSQEIGISQAQVSRLEKSAISDLKTQIS